jgi:hypothetical protein
LHKTDQKISPNFSSIIYTQKLYAFKQLLSLSSYVENNRNFSLKVKERKMDTTNITMIALAVVAGLVVGGLLGRSIGRMQRTKKLQQKFGPEYEHTVHELGDQRQAEKELAARLDHVKALDIRPLSEAEINSFTDQWLGTQVQFVDDPLAAIEKADQLIRKVMQAKGYPVEDFEQQVADISVDYPDLVRDYRGLHLIATKDRAENINTEEIRQAMVHGRALFENLVKRNESVEITEKEKI